MALNGHGFSRAARSRKEAYGFSPGGNIALYTIKRDALPLPRGLPVYGLAGEGAAVVAGRAALLFGRKVLPAEWAIVFLHLVVRLGSAEMLCISELT